MGLFDRLRSRARPSEATPTIPPLPVPDASKLIDEGNALEDQGQLEEALQRYVAALKLAPTLPRAHLNRGNALMSLGSTEEAACAYSAALVHDPDFAAAHFNLGNAYVALNRRDDALGAYRRALALKPDFADAEVALGALHQDLGQRDDAAASYRRAVKIDPAYGAAHGNLGNVLQEMGQPEQAIASYRRALELDPQLVMAHYGLGNALQALGRYGDAVASYRHVVQRHPDFAPAHGNLGNALQAIGQNEAAVASYRRVLQLAPELAKAHFDLGNALNGLARIPEAIASYRDAIRLDPKFVDAHCMLGNALKEETRFDEAFACYRRALEIDPRSADAHNNVGNTNKRLGRMKEAIASYESALQHEPDFALALGNLLFIQHALAEVPASTLLPRARRFGELTAQHARPFTTWTNAPVSDRMLRVGLVSGDLRSHAVAHFLESVLAALKSQAPSRVELHAYSNHTSVDAVSARIKASCRAWCLAAHMTDEALAQRIRDDGIDILIDLSGYTAFNRLQVFAWKPAPVQVTWLGYFATTGIAAIDYLIADPWALPESEDANFTERIWRLPETRLCFTPPDEAVAVGPLPALTNGYVTFGCFNDIAKMNDAVVALWARVLVAVPNSRLYLKSRQIQAASVGQDIKERFGRHGVDAGRLILEGASPRAEYLAAYGRVDISLDPFPYPGGTTTVEGLWMGVPVLTLAGETLLARQGVGLLMNAGLPEWVAVDEDDYVARAVSHADDLSRLAALRNGLRQQVLASPICDAPRFARNFEAALRGMWQHWSEQQGVTSR